MSFWTSFGGFLDKARGALPPCHVCGEPGVQYCSACGRPACHRHAFTNVGIVRSVCVTCMTPHFPWVAELIAPDVPVDWPYNETPWEILGVAPDATAQEVDAAWKRLSKEAHPDHGGSQERQVAVNRAREAMRGE